MKNPTVLFVDDEENLLSTFRRLFRKESFTALYANSGLEALELLNENEVNLLITDQRMPHMNGMVLCKKAIEKDLKLKVLLLSGDSDVSQYESQIDEGGLCGILHKPIDQEALLKAIYQLIKD